MSWNNCALTLAAVCGLGLVQSVEAAPRVYSTDLHATTTSNQLAFYYVSSRYESTNSGRFSDNYRKRHKYYGNDVHRPSRHQRHRAAGHRRYVQPRPLPPVIKPVSFIETPGKPTFVFNPSELNWGAYDASGRLINYGRASGGQAYCADTKSRCRTPVGAFKVYRKGGPDCKSSKFPLGRGGAPMGWCMFFKGGYAIHASGDVPNYNASHGCIRVKPDAAHWLANQFMKIGTRVVVRPH